MIASKATVNKVCNALRVPKTYVQLRSYVRLPQEELHSAIRALLWTRRIVQVGTDGKGHPMYGVVE